jgi:hypothetical protein
MKKCKYAMRYHSLLYFARPSTVAEAAEYQVSKTPPPPLSFPCCTALFVLTGVCMYASEAYGGVGFRV